MNRFRVTARDFVVVVALSISSPLNVYSQDSTETKTIEPPVQKAGIPDAGKIPELLERIARSQEASLAQRDMEQKDDRSDRDLAAQEEMAYWARWMFFTTCVGTVLSFGGLLALLHSLKITRDATRAARESLDLARTANEAEHRPWVSVNCSIEKVLRSETHEGVDGVYFYVLCKAENHGDSPAVGVSLDCEISLINRDTPSSDELMRSFCQRIREQEHHDAEAIFPSAYGTYRHAVFLPLSEIASQIANRTFKSIAPTVFGCVSYRSMYTSGIKQTRFSYMVGTVNEKGHTCTLRPDQDDWLNRPIVLLRPGTIVAD